MVVMWKMFETKDELFRKELQNDKSFWKKEEIVEDYLCRNIQGVSKKRTDHYLMIAQLLKHPQKKLRPFSKSPFRGLLKNVQNLEI